MKKMPSDAAANSNDDDTNKILFISSSKFGGYQSIFLYIGLYQAFPERTVFYRRMELAHDCPAPESWQDLVQRHGRGYSWCGRLGNDAAGISNSAAAGGDSIPTAYSSALYDSGAFSAIIYVMDGNRGCDGVIEGENFVEFVNDYLKKHENKQGNRRVKVVVVDGNDAEIGCHSLPAFDRVDVVFRREMIEKLPPKVY